MKRLIAVAALAAGFFCAASGAQAGWGVCGGCHNGMMAINRDGMVAKYPSVEALVKGAQATENPMMSAMKEDIEALKAAAAELGLKSEKEAR